MREAMKLRVLGCAGAEYPGSNLTAFLIDGKMLLDAGTIGLGLNESEQWNIKNILLTHSHLDHIKGIPFLADNIIMKQRQHSITLLGTRETLSSLSENLLNDTIWPDFTKISAAIDPVVRMKVITPARSFNLDGYKVRACRVNHTVPAVGYVITDKGGSRLVYTGDTGPTEEIWSHAAGANTLIVEVSFPNSVAELALKTGHLTAGLLRTELEKMKVLPKRILITHLKPQYRRIISREISKLGIASVEIIQDKKVYRI